MALSFLFDRYGHKPFRELTHREQRIFLLKALAAGAIVLTIIVAPGLGIIFKQLDARTKKEQRKVTKKIQYLVNKGYMERIGNRYKIAKRGIDLLTTEAVWNLEPPLKKKWDGKWHFVFFDIPGKKETARQALRARLQEIGAKRYQNSIFVFPHDLRSCIAPFARFYGIGDAVRFVVAEKIDDAQKFEKEFGLGK